MSKPKIGDFSLNELDKPVLRLDARGCLTEILKKK